MATDDAMLRTDGLVKEFGNFAAIDGVDIAVQPGEFRSIIGPNGPARRRCST
jgi:branched-chain amino acid transport system ATP-binding protein